jgi:hypothetical protein
LASSPTITALPDSSQSAGGHRNKGDGNGNGNGNNNKDKHKDGQLTPTAQHLLIAAGAIGMF